MSILGVADGLLGLMMRANIICFLLRWVKIRTTILSFLRKGRDSCLIRVVKRHILLRLPRKLIFCIMVMPERLPVLVLTREIC